MAHGRMTRPSGLNDYGATEPKPIAMRCHLHATANGRMSTASVASRDITLH